MRLPCLAGRGHELKPWAVCYQQYAGIISIARQGHKRLKSSGSGESADSPGSHGGQLTFRPSGNPLIATSSHDFSDIQVITNLLQAHDRAV